MIRCRRLSFWFSHPQGWLCEVCCNLCLSVQRTLRRYAWHLQVEEKQHQGLVALGSWKTSWVIWVITPQLSSLLWTFQSKLWCMMHVFFCWGNPRLMVFVDMKLSNLRITNHLFVWKALQASSKVWRFLPKANRFCAICPRCIFVSCEDERLVVWVSCKPLWHLTALSYHVGILMVRTENIHLHFGVFVSVAWTATKIDGYGT